MNQSFLPSTFLIAMFQCTVDKPQSIIKCISYYCKENEPKEKDTLHGSQSKLFPAVSKLYVHTFIINVSRVLTLMSQKNSRQ